MDKTVWRGTLILTVSAFVIKVLSAVYRLPYQNLAGDVGFYVYQQVYPFYALAAVMGGFGFPVVLSKIIAEVHKEDSLKKQTAFKTAYITLGIVGIILFLILFTGAGLLADIMGDSKLKGPLHMISFIFLFMPALASLRGYFQGADYNMLPTGVSQVAEQTVRVAIILGLSLFLFSHGAGPYAFGSAAAFGSMVAPLFAAFVLILFYLRIPRHHAQSHIGKWDRLVAKRLLIEGVAYTLIALSLVFFQFADGLTMIPLLDGNSGQAGRALKGIYDRAYPLIQMGLTASVALSTAIIPMVARLKETMELSIHIRQALRIAILFSAAASVGLFAIIKETDIMLFENDFGSVALGIMAFCILMASTVMTGASILQGVGHLFRPVVYLIICFLLKLLLNLFLIPTHGIIGAATATLISLSILAVLIFSKLRTMYYLEVFKKQEWVKLIITLITLYIGVRISRAIMIYGLGVSGNGRMESAAVALISVLFGASLFLICILRLGLLGWDEVEQLPGGKKLLTIFKRPN